jgi:hypothetical protein
VPTSMPRNMGTPEICGCVLKKDFNAKAAEESAKVAEEDGDMSRRW